MPEKTGKNRFWAHSPENLVAVTKDILQGVESFAKETVA